MKNIVVNQTEDYFTLYFIFTDQWSPVNREGKKIYDNNFILKLQNNPACQEKPKGLAVPEVVRDKVRKKIAEFLLDWNQLHIEGQLIFPQ